MNAPQYGHQHTSSEPSRWLEEPAAVMDLDAGASLYVESKVLINFESIRRRS